VEELTRRVCARLCRYHKPGHFEEPGCAGFALLASEKRAGKALLALDVSEGAGEEPLFGLDADDLRLLSVCALCDYPPDGCDFRNPAVDPATCAPCGGLRALALLLVSGHGLPPPRS